MELDPYTYPETHLRETWEELRSAWVEELREQRRDIVRFLNTEYPPHKNNIKFAPPRLGLCDALNLPACQPRGLLHEGGGVPA